MELYRLTLWELLQQIKSKKVSAAEAVEAYYKRIDQLENKIKAYMTLTKEEAQERAKKLNGSLSLGGAPLGIKDVICTKGIRTTCSSKILHNYSPPYNATVMEKLESAGAITLGKLNMDEFAMGSSTENSAYQITRNPWALERVPGGSSGGAAAAVAADMCAAALGSDTGGSIRQPAAFCGVVGLKPTYGRVSRFGLVAFASSLDQIGPITKDVRDSALMLQHLAGYDPKDSTSAEVPVPDYMAALEKGVKGLILGIPKEYFVPGMDPQVEAAIKAAIKVMEGLGARVEEVSLPHTDYAIATYYLVATAEASSNLARYDGVKYGLRVEGAKDLIEMYTESRSQGFGPEVKRRIMLGTYALSSGYYDAYYLKAQKVRTLIKQDFDRAWEKVNIILTPTSPTAAFKIGEKTEDPLQMYLSDIFTISVNLAGIPGLSLPCGFTANKLPIGLQILGKPFDEETLLRAAYAYEQATDWHKQEPGL